MQTLSKYLSSSGRTQRDLAAAVGCSRSYLSELVAGTKAPSLTMALRIVKATGGMVDIASLEAPGSASAEAGQ